MTQINLQLSIEEVDFILQSLGEMPTKSGALDLIRKIQQQGSPQVPEELKQKE
jgi:hypothetical protein